ncbi:P450 monooxygenase [Diplogelasinospora grovesii]|uniref:P450 monooxygenase n=1 Tax=Diplogelasinospora grovesii TaxID=303347 RepID=A0AAN6S7I2_9PEZI|nr:P450 monooxygenase [Diplogelasinospora grovesii]
MGMEITPILGAPLLLFCLFRLTSTLTLFTSSTTFPEDIPIVGVRKQIFKVCRASIRQLYSGVRTLLEGYTQYSQHGKPFVVYDPSARQELLLPAEHVKWFSEQPDSKLSSHDVRQERHAVRYLQKGVNLEPTMHFMERICGDRLSKNLHTLQEPLHDELRRCIDTVFGTADEWKGVCVYSAMEVIVMPAMSRVFLGLPLSRDPRILTAFRRYILAMGLAVNFVGELPKALKGVVARVVGIPLSYYRWQTLRVLTPVVAGQLKYRLEKTQEGDGADFIRHCAKISEKNMVGGKGVVSDPRIIAEWIMSLGFAGSTSTIIQSTNLLLDVAYCQLQTDVIESLHQEAEAAGLDGGDENWAKRRTFDRELVLADSAIRETLRYHPMLIKGMTKEIVSSEGLTLPDGKTHLPQGGWVGVPTLGIHRDERFYPHADVYDPFRFVPTKKPGFCNSTEKTVTEEDDDEKLLAGRPTTTYLGFGYGRHACPGRWVSVLMLKMILVYITLHYDVEPGDRPPPQNMKVLGDAVLPPTSATIRVRRRKAAGR